jgi:hypothetical protein
VRYLFAIVLVGTLLIAQPAAAHPSDPDAGYYRAEVTGVAPATPGVTARVDAGGEWIEMSNTGPAEVVVLGYGREPYLRLTATSAEENEVSQSAVLNRSLFADLPTGGGGAAVAPVWRRTADKGIVRWHDHRIHWMGRDRPPSVAADPTRPHLVGTWTVHATADGTPLEVTGTLRWLGKPADRASPWQVLTWVVLAAMTLVVGVLTVALIRARRRSPAVSSGRPSAPSGGRPGTSADQGETAVL